MLSVDIKKKAQYKTTHPRMANVHDQDHVEADGPDNPEPGLDNQFHEDSYPMQDTDVKDILETHG